MSQIQTVLVQGLYISKGEFTPENGKNKGVPTPYDNLNIHAAIPFPAENMDAKGCKEQIFKLKGSGNYYRFKDVELPGMISKWIQYCARHVLLIARIEDNLIFCQKRNGWCC